MNPTRAFMTGEQPTPGGTSPGAVARPDTCPSCRGRVIDTLAKVINVNTTWRCCQCQHTWTIASLQANALRNSR